ncbi:MAG: helix-turn-helix domain-containing protein [Armatimonadetes bacterium]|jgi:transcriptional regulator with XRE-family HTH domain|nr:helix-turn-helix domain-containing protein [Armatimonadota bacterium]
MATIAKIRQIRRQQGLAVDALAYKAGVSPRTLILWEKYGFPPKRREVVEKIANALGVRPEDLLEEGVNDA